MESEKPPTPNTRQDQPQRSPRLQQERREERKSEKRVHIESKTGFKDEFSIENNVPGEDETRGKGSCLKWLPCRGFIKTFWQDTVILFYWYHYILIYLACAIGGCGFQFLILGIYQVVQINHALTPELQSWDLWVKLVGAAMLLISACSLIYSTCYTRLWLLYLSIAVGLINLVAVIGGGVLMKQQTSSEEINSVLHAFVDDFSAKSSSDVVNTVNRLQTEFTCCGVTGEADYGQKSGLPDSCCLNVNKTSRTLGKCESNASAELNFEGCSLKFQLYREAMLDPNHVFFLLAVISLLFGLALTLCYAPLAKKMNQMLANARLEEEGLDDPFRRSLIASAILAQIDDELLEDEVMLPPREREMLEKFRQRVAACHSMTGIHGIIADSADLIKLLKESGKKVRAGSPELQARVSTMQTEKENERLSVRMQGV